MQLVQIFAYKYFGNLGAPSYPFITVLNDKAIHYLQYGALLLKLVHQMETRSFK